MAAAARGAAAAEIIKALGAAVVRTVLGAVAEAYVVVLRIWKT